MPVKVGKHKKGVGITVFTALIALIFFFPVLMAVINSFKTRGEILASAIALPSAPTLANYAAVIEATDFVKVFFNSCLVTGGGIVLNLLVSALAGYALARWRSKWANILTLLFLSSMFVPFHTIMIALLTTARDLKLTGHIWGLILIYCGLQCPIPIFLIKGFVHSVPRELEEAAYIDGCGTIRTFFRVMLPNARTMMTTVFMFSFCWQYTDTDYSQLYYNETKVFGNVINTIYIRVGLSAELTQSYICRNAACLLILIPLVAIFIFAQRGIVKSIAMSGMAN